MEKNLEEIKNELRCKNTRKKRNERKSLKLKWKINRMKKKNLEEIKNELNVKIQGRKEWRKIQNERDLKRRKKQMKKGKKCLFFWFYGISTFVGYLMPNEQFDFNISTRFNCQKYFYFKLFSLVQQF